ncbi:MAG: DUF2341 domain-containing protein [Proteobacteria bacterium]|nr:DUF2341 domain-containing protein [Pseudomonadota bacterium]MCP4918119.1 DUF2341 domain-containing protein [Pseudomonadota bacterium]
MLYVLALIACRNKGYNPVESGLTEDSGLEADPDLDGDGYPQSEDCDDDDVAVNPGATELCNGIDDDCDTEVDEDATGATAWYTDGDGDGYGDPDSEVLACEQPSGMIAQGEDCDDVDAAFNPGATEDCADPTDYNCDGSVAYDDADGDGWAACEECDDTSADVNPDAIEVCNDIDDDCDGAIDEDEAADALIWYADTDTDGYGDRSLSRTACDQPSGYVLDDTDCDDAAIDVNPGETEVCNDVDDDCDGAIDEDDAADAGTWYADTDTDGYGDAASTTASCDQPAGYVTDDTDCDDTSADVSPAETETCNSVDDDCDTDVDEDDASDADTWYADTDTDGYGDASSTTTSCDQPSGYVADDTDCDDTSADVSPADTEICNGIDDDCDTDVDEDLIGSGSSCPGDSCLDVLERGTPTDSDDYWIDPDGSGAYEEYCDYGTVGSGWSRRLELELDNSTGSALTDEQVPVSLDTATLIAAGTLEDGGEDLRFFTHDGPLLAYWIETHELDSAATTVWVTFPDLDTGTTDFTVTFGNSGTERKSTAWWYDDFDSDTSGSYAADYASSWGTPSFAWDTGTGTIGPDSTNQDFYLVPDADLDSTLYIEVEGWIHDNDAIGVSLEDTSGAWISAVITNDYDGAQHNGGDECIVEHSAVPTGHYQGTQLLDLGNLVDATSSQVVGLEWDGTDLSYWLNGTEEGSVADSVTVSAVALSTFASQGSPGAEFTYVWVGPEPIDFDPSGLSSDATATTGTESAF